MRNVTRTYVTEAEAITAVNGVTLTAEAGQLICVFGRSGSGKSTLLNLIAGLDIPDAGDVRVGDRLVQQLDEVARVQLRLQSVGVVFQDDGLIPEFTAAENVALPLEAQGVRTPAALRQAESLLARVGLEGLAGRLPAQLSGGQRQRVGVARAIAGGRRILLADEPTGALDTTTSADLFQLIRDLCDNGTLAIVCSHDPGCRVVADCVYEISDGVLTRCR